MLHTIFNWWNYSIVDSLILITALLTLTNSKSIASNFTLLDYALVISGGLFIGLKVLSYIIWQKPIENVPTLPDNTYFLGNTTLHFPNPKVHEVLLSNAERYGDVYQAITFENILHYALTFHLIFFSPLLFKLIYTFFLFLSRSLPANKNNNMISHMSKLCKPRHNN